MSIITTNKLYLVKLKGLYSSTGMNYNISYVVAKDLTEAYAKVRNFLDEEDYGFRHERELDSITLLSEDYKYAECRTRLFL